MRPFGALPLALLLLPILASGAPADPVPRAAERDPHAPIAITSDALLLLPDVLVGNGVRRGSGTASDPYVIEGWDIDASSQDGILLSGVTRHVVIRNNRIANGLESAGRYVYSGIVVQNSGNVTIEGNDIENCYDGIFLRERVRARVEGNRVDTVRNAGIESWASEATLLGNDIRRSDRAGVAWAAEPTSPLSASVRGNVLADVEVGIHVRGGRDHVVEGNRVSRAVAQALLVETAQGTSLLGSNLADGSATGVEVSAARADVRDNVLARNALGLLADGGVRASGNAIHDNARGVVVLAGEPELTGNDLFDNRAAGLVATPGTLAAGNWWGSRDGPSGMGPGRGDRVEGGVFAPFAASPWTVAGRNRGEGASLGYGGPPPGDEAEGDAWLGAVLLAGGLAVVVAGVWRARRRRGGDGS
ncbi:MAG TPA: right-handed parallel beta-helix repeat-containing protein [Candidatus Thermoplasmatota archaeon]|nr:right-handed parallel beta-helix repeat-containing protein [Candidatus Thermoplasmatota archaeon]